jgi:hypothetical protein
MSFFKESNLFFLLSSVSVNHNHSAGSKLNQIETWHLTLKKGNANRIYKLSFQEMEEIKKGSIF